MAYCPECGEKTSDTDPFCAYCGIALPSVGASPGGRESASPEFSAPAEEAEAFWQTEGVAPAAPPPHSTAPEELKPPIPASEKPKLETPAGFGANPFAPEVLEKDTAENWTLNTDSDLTPTRTADERAETNVESPISESSLFAEPEVPTPNLFDESSEVEEIPPAAELSTPEIDSLQKENSLSGGEPFPVAGNDFKAPESDFSGGAESKTAPENEKDAYNADFEQTVPYMPAGLAKKQPPVPTAESARPPAENAVPPANREAAHSQSFSSMPTPNRTDAIAMPETPIEGTAHDSLEPKLVSVNILPDFDSAAKRSAEQDSAATRLKPGAKHSIQPEKDIEKHSFTSPNIGVTDTAGKKAAKLKPLDEGTVLNGRYEIVRKIGGGGMGAVYLASDRNLGGVLRAVKEMVQSYIEDAQQEKAVNDFRRESLLLTSLEHPSIPTIFDYFYDEKECRFYLVMKYISGGDLAARLRAAPGGKIDETSVTEWAIQVADVLDYLHNRQPPIVYRDLKPSNVMIDGNSGRVMIIDFGIARWVNKEEKGVTAVGTMGYAPPELFSGNVEPRSDIYSLGSTIFHLLTGADPQSNPLLIFDFHKNPRPRQINSRLSDQIEQILVRAVEYNAEHRFKTAAEMRGVLTKHLENLRKGAVTYGAGDAATAVQAPASSQPVFCGFCGQKILITDLFCPFCGAQQPLAAQEKSAPLAPARPAAANLTARLLVLGTNDLDAPQFSLDKDNSLVGRRDPMSNIFPEVDLSKFDPQTKISRRHARIWRESNLYMLEDLGSSNGTVLMSAAKEALRLPPRQPHVLAHGDKIRVGDTLLHFFMN